jgi:uncharacterized protein (TIGR03382 family)
MKILYLIVGNPVGVLFVLVGVLNSVLVAVILLFIVPIANALIVIGASAGAAGTAGVVAAAHLQLQRRRKVHRLALKISCENIKKVPLGAKN